jgi:hypothetical protein
MTNFYVAMITIQYHFMNLFILSDHTKHMMMTFESNCYITQYIVHVFYMLVMPLTAILYIYIHIHI